MTYEIKHDDTNLQSFKLPQEQISFQCHGCGTKEGYLLSALKDNQPVYVCMGCLIKEQFQTETKQAIMDVLIDDKEYKDIYFDINSKEKQPT